MSEYTPTTDEIRSDWEFLCAQESGRAQEALTGGFDRWLKSIQAAAWDAAATHAYQHGAMSLIEAPNPYRTEIPNA